VVALARGIIRDLMIGVPPATFRDGRYLVAAGAAGVVSFFARPALERVDRGVTFFDALGLGVFCVTGASAALAHRLGPAQSIILGAITGVGGGMVRDLLLRNVPDILRRGCTQCPRCSARASSSSRTGLGASALSFQFSALASASRRG
jgi:uncharacterized membrane protein YeiH